MLFLPLPHFQPRLRIEQRRIGCRLISQENTYRQQHKRTEPHTCPARPQRLARHLVARIVNNIINDKHHNGDNHRCPQPSLANDSTQRGTNKEKYQAGKSQCKLAVQLNLVLANIALRVIQQEGIVLNLVTLRGGLIHRRLHRQPLLPVRQMRKKRINIVRLALVRLNRYQHPTRLALSPEITVFHQVSALVTALLLRQNLH